MSVCVVCMAYRDSLLEKSWNLQSNKFVNICKNHVLSSISKLTVSLLFREMSSMMNQLILNLDTSDNGVYYNGESVCIALCNIAKLHAENVSHMSSDV